jgi:hypothetical protein
MPEDDKKCRYFSSVPGHAVARYGTGTTIGASRGPTGYVFNTDVVVAIPEAEFYRYMREYKRALLHKELVERTKEDFDSYRAKRNEARKKSAQTGSTPKPTVDPIPAKSKIA